MKMSLSVNDAVVRMREAGIHIGTKYFREGAQAGKFPFVIAVKSENGRWRYYISEAMFNEFLRVWREGR